MPVIKMVWTPLQEIERRITCRCSHVVLHLWIDQMEEHEIQESMKNHEGSN